MFRSMKILHKITLAYVLLIIIPLLILISISYYQYYQKEKNSILINEKAELNKVIDTIQEKVQTVENISTSILTNTRLLNYLSSSSYTKPFTSKEFQESTKSIFEYTLMMHKLNIHSVKLFIVDDRMTQYDNIIHSESEINAQDWYQAFYNSDDQSRWLGPIGIGYLTGDDANTKKLYSYCKKLIAENGDYEGIIVISITQDTLIDQNLVSLNTSTSFHMVDSKSTTLNSTKGNVITLSSNELSKIRMQAYYIYTEKTQLYMWKYIPELNQYLGISQQLDSPLFLKSDNLIIMLIILGILFSILFVFYFYVKKIFDEIKKKIKEVDTIVKQDFVGRIETKRQDEIGEISQSFNVLLDTIHLLVKDVVAKEVAQKDANLKALQYQINPHFIYNTIEVFSTSMELAGSFEIADAMAAFGKMLRYNLRNESNFSTIKDELEHVKSYINIEKIKYFDQLHLTIDCNEELFSIPIIRFLMQPIVENSISHGFKDRTAQMNIFLKIHRNDGLLYFSVIDDGFGINEQKLIELNESFARSLYLDNTTDQHGIGLRNINERLKLFYGNDHHIKIQSTPQRTSVSFTVPI